MTSLRSLPVGEVDLSNDVHEGKNLAKEKVESISSMSLCGLFEVLLNCHHTVKSLIFLLVMRVKIVLENGH